MGFPVFLRPDRWIKRMFHSPPLRYFQGDYFGWKFLDVQFSWFWMCPCHRVFRKGYLNIWLFKFVQRFRSFYNWIPGIILLYCYIINIHIPYRLLYWKEAPWTELSKKDFSSNILSIWRKWSPTIRPGPNCCSEQFPTNVDAPNSIESNSWSPFSPNISKKLRSTVHQSRYMAKIPHSNSGYPSGS